MNNNQTTSKTKPKNKNQNTNNNEHNRNKQSEAFICFCEQPRQFFFHVMKVWFSERLYLCECCFPFRGSIRSRKDSRLKCISQYVRSRHMRPCGDRPFSLKTDFLLQQLHILVFKQNMIFQSSEQMTDECEFETTSFFSGCNFIHGRWHVYH